ncbi:MAG TPA: class I SAM-dependent rRNA methyltransferase [Trueperaceae bacterium]
MLRTLNLGKDLEKAVSSGHPWVYRDSLPRHSATTGEWLRVEAGKASAYGLYDEEGAIAVRIFSSEGLPDKRWFAERVEEALELRSDLIGSGTDAYRLVYGEGDGLPGVVVDRYGRYAVAKAYSPGVRSILSPIVKALASAIDLRGVSERSAAGLEPLYGQLPPPELTVEENGLRLLANLYEGQKTGLFLDQRDNRATVRGFAGGRSVLNLFSYNGGFSVSALAGGATSVVSVDMSEPALEDARRTVRLNGFDQARHETVTADVFEYLASGSTDRYGLVVCDPPSLAHAKRSRHAALRAYRKLNRGAFSRVEPGGLLATSSCTAQVSPEEFRRVVAEAAAEAGLRAQIVHEAGQPLDHPVPAHFPEGRYLKFLVLRVLEPA